MKYVIMFLILFWSLPVSAWEAMHDKEGCPIYWHSDEVTFVWGGVSGIPGITHADTEAAIITAIEYWNSIDTENFSIHYGGHRLHASEGFSLDDWKNGTSLNVIEFECSDWPYPDHEMATTLWTYDLSNGAFIDADILVNCEHFRFGIYDSDSMDLVTILAHEIGHALGLDHSEDKEAVMFGGLLVGEVRTVNEDDRNGYWYLYALDEEHEVTEVEVSDRSAIEDRSGEHIHCSSGGSFFDLSWSWVFYYILGGFLRNLVRTSKKVNKND